jgi:hypothetical protein
MGFEQEQTERTENGKGISLFPLFAPVQLAGKPGIPHLGAIEGGLAGCGGMEFSVALSSASV